MSYLLLCLFGAAAGMSSGLLGIGGGVILVPGLIWLFGMSQQEAQGTSLAVMIPPIGLFAAVVYYQHGYVRLPVVGWLAAGFIAGAWLGAHLVPYVTTGTLRTAFGILLLYVGVTFVWPLESRPASALPHGLATLAALFAARILGRRFSATRKPPPPDRDVEYHI